MGGLRTQKIIGEGHFSRGLYSADGIGSFHGLPKYVLLLRDRVMDCENSGSSGLCITPDTRIFQVAWASSIAVRLFFRRGFDAPLGELRECDEVLQLKGFRSSGRVDSYSS